MSWQSIGTAVGTVVGAYFGYPQLGAVIGGMIGGQADLAAMPTSKLDDLSAQRVSFGQPIPLMFGHPRMAGSVVWCSDAIGNGKVGSAKGDGGGQETYIRHLIIVHSENASGPIVRSWAAGKLVRNLRGDADDETITASIEESPIVELLYHDGDAEQLPFSTYASVIGDEFAIAYRGRPSSFLTVDCGTSGQLPPMTHEFAGAAAQVELSTVLRYTELARSDYLFEPPVGSFQCGNVFRLCSISNGIVRTTTGGTGAFEDTDIPTGSIELFPAMGNGDAPLIVFGLTAFEAGFAWSGGGRSGKILLPDSGHRIGSSEIRFSVHGSKIAIGTNAEIGQFENEPDGASGNPGWVYVYDFNGTLEYTYKPVVRVESLALIGERLFIQDTDGTIHVANAETIDDWFEVPATGSGWRIFPGADDVLYACDSDANIYKWQDEEWIFVVQQILSGVDLGTGNCAHGVSKNGDVFAVEMYAKPVYGFWNGWWLSWTSDQPYPSLSSAISAAFPYIYEYSYRFGVNTYTGQVAIRPRRNMTLGPIDEYVFSPPGIPHGYTVEASMQIYYWPYELIGDPYGTWETVDLTQTFYQQRYGPEWTNEYYHNVYRTRVTPLYDLTEPTLQEVVEALCYRAGLEPEAIEADELATKNVHAFAVTQVGATSAALELLMAVYRFYCVESAGKLVFRFIGGDSVRTIPYQDFGATFGEPPADPLPMTRASELELPSMESVRYSNIDNDYQDGLESSDRLLQAVQSARTVEYAIGLTPDEAKQLAVVTQQAAQAGLIRVGPFSLGPEHRDLELGEPIIVTRQDGSTVQILPARSTYDRGVLTIEGASYDAAAYDSDATTSNNYTEAVTVRTPPDTEMVLFDPPLLQDSDDGPSFKVVAKPSRYPWGGYSFNRSLDEVAFSELYQDTRAGVFGEATTVLADWTGGNVVDWMSKVRVDVGDELSSITRTELLTTRLNLCMIGDELLQFQFAELVDTGVYDLSRFVRYLGGTEWATHSSGEDFILIDSSKISRVSVNLADLGQSQYYKSVTLGRSIDTADSVQFAPNLVSMKPISPANLRAIYLPNGDILLRWNRRTRYQSNSLRGIVPLGESSESYVITTLDGTTVLSNYTSSSEEYLYTAAQQDADGIGSWTDLVVIVTQVGQIAGTPAKLSLET